MMEILKGVRVLDLSHVVAGPLASYYLAQLGAEVIKIEPPGGEVMRAASRTPGVGDQFATLNAGKRSLAVDIRTPEGAAIVRDLAKNATVFLENFRPGVMARHGLDEAAIRAVNPDIVYCSISGFGQEGAWAGRPAYDQIVQAVTGMMMMGGNEGDPPVKVGFPVIDVAVGLLGALSVVSALYARLTQGRGLRIDASMVSAAMALMHTYAAGSMTAREPHTRTGNRGFTGSPGSDVFRCADGWISVAANTPAQFRSLTAVLGIEDLCADGRILDLEAFNAASAGFVRPLDFAAARRRLEDAFLRHSAADIEARLLERSVPTGRVRTLNEFIDAASPDNLVLSGSSFDQDGHPMRTPGLGFRITGGGDTTSAGAPRLGESGAALLRELGRSEAEIERLVASGVVRCPEETISATATA